KASMAYLIPGGLMIVNVPASRFLYSRYDEACGHKRRYSEKDLTRLFENAGLEINVLSPWGCALYPLLLIRRLRLLFSDRQNWIRDGFAPPGKLTSFIISLFMHLERIIPFAPPFGSSVLVIAKLPGK
ncbi:MAG TPA: hypothetical protein VGO45_12620, partial [Bacteroidia bacterium]|nr:hypothetical protein [Bacteroidia bacterium]